jgi:hypothetical protein
LRKRGDGVAAFIKSVESDELPDKEELVWVAGVPLVEPLCDVGPVCCQKEWEDFSAGVAKSGNPFVRCTGGTWERKIRRFSTRNLGD